MTDETAGAPSPAPAVATSPPTPPVPVVEVRPTAKLLPMADGSAVAVNPRGEGLALNADAAALWPAPRRPLADVVASYATLQVPQLDARAAAIDFIDQLVAAELVVLRPEG
jgi:hypothetical protein